MAAIAVPVPRTEWRVASASPVRPTPASVYRRRRAVVIIATLAAVAGLRAGVDVLGGGPLTAAEVHSTPVVAIEVEPVAREVYVVRAGDTLWSIARKVQPAGDVRPLVDRLAESRGGRALQPGERIVLP